MFVQVDVLHGKISLPSINTIVLSVYYSREENERASRDHQQSMDVV